MEVDDMTAERKALGADGERRAAQYLSDQGLQILDRNWRCVGSKEERAGKALGEIDIVAWDKGDVLVVVEVKTRSGKAFGTPEQAVGLAKYRRLRKLGARWMEEHQAHPREVRIDVVAVLMEGKAASIHHTMGAYR
jgi:putative endonuclease